MKRFMSLVAAAGVLVGGASAEAGGPGVRGRETLKARHYLTHTWTFRGGEIARIVLSGDGDTDLDLYVYDEFGNLIAKDDDASDDCLVEFVPRWTGRFTVKVVNRGDVYNTFEIATN